MEDCDAVIDVVREGAMLSDDVNVNVGVPVRVTLGVIVTTSEGDGDVVMEKSFVADNVGEVLVEAVKLSEKEGLLISVFPLLVTLSVCVREPRFLVGIVKELDAREMRIDAVMSLRVREADSDDDDAGRDFEGVMLGDWLSVRERDASRDCVACDGVVVVDGVRD